MDRNLSPETLLRIRQMESEIEHHRTSHFLHLVLTLLTAGVWLVIWLVVALANQHERSLLEDRINELKLGKPDPGRLTWFGIAVVALVAGLLVFVIAAAMTV